MPVFEFGCVRAQYVLHSKFLLFVQKTEIVFSILAIFSSMSALRKGNDYKQTLTSNNVSTAFLL